MKLNITFPLLIFLLLFATAAYAQDTDEIFDYGHIKEGKYTNAFFNLEVDVPQDWDVQSKEQMDRLHKLGSEIVAGDDEKLKALIKASDVNSAKLLMAYKYKLGSSVDYNPGLSLNIVNIKSAPAIKNGNDYLFQVKRFLEKSQLQYKSIDDEFKKDVINGIDFYIMKTEITYLGIDVTQVYYCTVIKEFSLFFVISFTNKNDEKELREILSLLKIKK